MPFEIVDPKSKLIKTKENLNIVISSAAGGIGLTVSQYLFKLGYKNVYGIAGTDAKCQVAMELGCKACINYKNFYDGEKVRAKQFEEAIVNMMGGEKCDIYY